MNQTSVPKTALPPLKIISNELLKAYGRGWGWDSWFYHIKSCYQKHVLFTEVLDPEYKSWPRIALAFHPSVTSELFNLTPKCLKNK